MLRVTAPERPVARMRNVPDEPSSIDSWAVAPGTHLSPAAGSSSIVYCDLPSGIVRQRRVSGWFGSDGLGWLTGLGSDGVGPVAVSHKRPEVVVLAELEHVVLQPGLCRGVRLLAILRGLRERKVGAGCGQDDGGQRRPGGERHQDDEECDAMLGGEVGAAASHWHVGSFLVALGSALRSTTWSVSTVLNRSPVAPWGRTE